MEFDVGGGEWFHTQNLKTTFTKLFKSRKELCELFVVCPIITRVGGSFRSLEILTLPPLYMFMVMLFTFKEEEIIPSVGNYH